MAPRRLVLLMPLLFAACAAEREAGSAAALQVSLETTRASLAALGAPAGRAAPAWPGPAVPATLPASRLPGRDAPPLEAAQLLGLAAEQVRGWLGEPALRRPEGPAEIWLYSAPACHLDLVLYREERAGRAAGPLRVGFAAARAAGAERRSEAACLDEIAAQARIPAATGEGA
jgi:hypothetical protein